MPYKDLEKNKEYQKKYQKEWYNKNKKKHYDNTRINKKRHVQQMMKFTSDYKGERGCYCCPENNPACLDFHHTEDDKDINVSVAIQKGWGKQKIKEEISKCVVICSNCHRKLHAGLIILLKSEARETDS